MSAGRGRFLWLAGLAAALLVTGGAAARFFSPIAAQSATAPDALDGPLALRIWFPKSEGFGDHMRGTALPLIVISHGAGGSAFDHADTARTLARAGFVVVALTHAGDNYRDQSYVGRGLHLLRRPGQVERTIDYMLTAWPEHAHIDANRVGMFGFSAGGFTTLVLAGGAPDLSRAVAHCRTEPDAWDCLYLRRRGWRLHAQAQATPPDWSHDPRIKAIVVAAPAVGYSFAPDHLAEVTIPVQLWGADHDDVVEDSALIVRRLLPRRVEFHLVQNAGHFSFIAPCSWIERAAIIVGERFGVPAICSDRPGFDRPAFHKVFDDAVTAFFRIELAPSKRGL